MAFTDLSCREFTDSLASKTPIPGGGGASAIAAAIGAALGTMVGNFTIGKRKYASVEPEIIELMEKAEKLRNELLDLTEKDAEAFSALSDAYAMPKDSPTRESEIQKRLVDAAQVPFKIMELSCEVIDLQCQFAEKGSTLMISDAGVGCALCQGSMCSAALNVRVNTKLMTDREFAENLNTKTDALLEKYNPIAQQLYNSIYNTLK